MELNEFVDPFTLTEAEFNLASKNVKKKLKKNTKKSESLTEKCIATIPSSNSDTNYQLFLLNDKNNGIHFECNCGEQFGIDRRRNCKHIASIIHNCTTNFFKSQINNSEKSNTKNLSKKRKHSSTLNNKNTDINNVITAFENLFC
jgi:hypothetical protein